MRETVLGETPASLATISRVTAEPLLLAAAWRSSSDRRIRQVPHGMPGQPLHAVPQCSTNLRTYVTEENSD
jgi:hypothetical protein